MKTQPHNEHPTDHLTIARPSRSRRAIAWLTLIAYVGQPLVVTAQVVADQAAAPQLRPVVDSTANGLPLVQITTPSAAGVSRNQYTHFSVDPSGVILNNSQINVQTQLGGFVAGNSNLAGGSARIILNEVTSTNSSQLNGYTEVAGQRAEVVIANPNGISCNGCGFINTSRGVLTTGIPVMGGSGSLDAFRVTGGQIDIGAGGLNGGNTDQLDLIARSVKVNGQLWGNTLNVVTGANQVNYANLGVQLIPGDANKPVVGIDVALLGGMYANKIRLIGTEAGVGVNSLGTLSAQAGDFMLDNQGRITLSGTTSATGNLAVNGKDGVSNSGTLSSRLNAQVTSQGDIVNSGTVAAGGNLALSGANVNSTGTLGAGIDANGGTTQNGNLSVTASGRIDAVGQNLAGGNLALSGASVNLGNSQTAAGGNASLNASAGNLELNNAQLQVTGSATLNAAGAVLNNTGSIVAGQLGMSAASLSNRSGSLSIGGLTDIIVTGAIDNTLGSIETGAALNISGASLDNSAGRLLSLNGDGFNLNVTGQLTNSAGIAANGAVGGVIGGNGNVGINAGNLSNNSSISAFNNLSVNAIGMLDNSNGVLASGGALTASAGSTLKNTLGIIDSASLASLSATQLDNGTGTIAANQLGLSAVDLNNVSGSISQTGTGATTLAIQNLLDNSGGLIQTNSTDLSLTPQTLLNDQGSIVHAGTGVFTLNTGTLSNNGGVIGSNGQALISASSIANQGGRLIVQKQASLTSQGLLDNSAGGYIGADSLTLSVAGLINNSTGTMEANNGFMLTGLGLDNSGGTLRNLGAAALDISLTQGLVNTALNSVRGFVGGNGLVNISAGSLDNTGSTIYGNSDLTLQSGSAIGNLNGLIQTDGNLGLNAVAALDNRNGRIEANGIMSSATVSAASIDNTSGRIANSGSGLTRINGGTQIVNGNGILGGNGNVEINATDLFNTQAGQVISGGNLVLNSSRTLDNRSGSLYAAGSLTLAQINAVLDNSAGNISAYGDINLSASSINNTNGQIGNLAAGGGSTALTTSGNLTNTGGKIGSDLDLVIRANTIAGNGQIIAGRDADIGLQGNYVNSAGNVLKANRNLSLALTGSLTNQTILEAVGGLTLSATGITNQAGAVINSAATSLNTAGNIVNAGRIDGNSVATTSNNFTNTGSVMGNVVTLNANNLSNQNAAAIIAATQSVSLIVQSALNNLNGATIYSLGDINIGATNTLDTAGYVAGNAASVTNSTATIEASGNLRISANQLTNKRTVVGFEWGPQWAGAYVAGNPRYTPYYQNERLTAASTAASQILSGNDMWLKGNIANQYSTVAAGRNLAFNAAQLTQTSRTLLQHEIDIGQQDNFVLLQIGSYSCGWFSACPIYGWVNQPIAYRAERFVPIGAVNASFTANNRITGAAIAINNQAVTGANGPVGGTAATLSATLGATNIVGGINQTPATNTVASASPTVSAANPATASLTAALQVPSSGLYTVHSNPGQKYLVETDARFTSYKNFLSSDYLLGRMALDPQRIQKRLGDGFYEQKLVSDQVTELTGRRYLAQVGSAEDQFKMLMDSGIAAAREFNLTPGIALSAAQLAALTSDIVWMVEQDVTLADGSKERVLVPQVYLGKLHSADLKPSGALIAADDISIQTRDTLQNSGTIMGGSRTLLIANDIVNRGGSIASNGDTLLQAANDIFNQSGSIDGQRVALLAGRDIRNERIVSSLSQGVVDTTLIHRAAGITSSGTLDMQAGRDLTLAAANIGAGGNATLQAGRDLKVQTIAVTESSAGGASSSINRVAQLTSSLHSGGDLTLNAGNNLQLTSVQLDAQQNLNVIAGGNVTLDSSKDVTSSQYDSGVRQERHYDETLKGTQLSAGNNVTLIAGGAGGQTGNISLEAATVNSQQGRVALVSSGNIDIKTASERHESMDQTRTESKGVLSSSSTTVRNESSRTDAIGSTLSGDSIAIQSDRDINITGSSIAGTNDVGLTAANDINIKAATSTYRQSQSVHTEESGLMSNGGLSITLGSRERTDKTDSNGTLQSQNRSIVGSTNGSLSLTAGTNAKVSGSDIVAANDINLRAENVTIDTGLDQQTNRESHDFKQSGLTLALSSPVLAAAQTVQQMAQAASQTKDARTKALAGMTAAMSVKNAYDAVQAGQTVLNKDGQNVANAADKAGGISVSISLGSSSNHSESTQTSAQHFGSSVAAGNNVNITASSSTGDNATESSEQHQQEGNITVAGSDIKAGNNVSLNADNQLNLLAAQNTASQQSSNNSSNASIGLSFGLGGGQSGLSLNIAASKARGNADGNDAGYSNTHVAAGNQLTLNSGADTNLIGATASGKQVTADIGGDLNIQSLQDTSTYASKQNSAGFSVSLCIPPFCTGMSGGSINASQSNINSNYASVQEQSGIKAGDGGYQVNVNGNTDLKGAVIASNDQAIQDGNNTFATGGTLAMSDIQNSASYSADSSGFSAGVGSQLGASGGLGSDSGNASSVTKSGIGVSTGKDTTGAIAKIFDANKVTAEVNAQMQITQAFSQAAPKAVGDYASGKLQEAQKLRDQADKETDPGKQAALNDQASALESNWKEGGTARVALHTIVGALGGGVEGAIGAGVSAATVPLIAAQIDKLDVPPEVKQALILTAGAAVGGAAGGTAGAVTGLAQVGNNYLKHSEVTALLKNIKDCNGNTNCINPLIKAATDLSNSRNAMDLLDPALAQDVAAGSILLGTAANNSGTYGFAVSSGTNGLLGINNTQQAKANAVPILTAPPVKTHPYYDSYLGQQAANLSPPLLVAGAAAVVAAGGGMLYDMGAAAQTVPLTGGVTNISTGRWVTTAIMGSGLSTGTNLLMDPNASPLSLTVSAATGAFASTAKLGLNAAAGLANQWFPTTANNLITYSLSKSMSNIISIPANQVLDSKSGSSSLTTPVLTCGPYPRKPC